MTIQSVIIIYKQYIQYYGNSKINVSARVESTLKRIVKESDYTHKDAYELGAKLIAKGDAEETINSVNRDPELERTIKKAEYQIVEERKNQLERELRDL